MSKRMTTSDIREMCESDCYEFAQWVMPDRYYGDVHKDMFHYFQHDKHACKLALVPRDHQKSHCIAVFVAWLITVKPWITINYVSANPRLVEAQLRTIKDILRGKAHRQLWPDHLNFVRDRDGTTKHKPTETWTQKEFSIDHPERKKRAVRDHTLTASTVNGTNTGLHCEVTVFDDLVTDENYLSAAEKQSVIDCYKNFAKISSTGSHMYAVGTRYGDDDLYAMMKDIVVQYTDNEGTPISEPRWAIFEKVVEDSPNRTGDGVFIWPRQQSPITGEWFGFDTKELAIKKADLHVDGDITGYYAQYYNDPNDASLNKLSRNDFKYFNPHLLVGTGAGNWEYSGKPLKLFAAADLAFTDGIGANAKKRDYTAVIVIGIDTEGYIYILDLQRFQTDKMEVYYQEIMNMADYWGFRKITVETNNGGKLVKRYLEDEIRREGGFLEVAGVAHTSHDGKKEERIAQALEPRYRSGTIYHHKGGVTKILEEELVLNRPPHRDLKDVLAIVIENSRSTIKRQEHLATGTRGNVVAISRFGGSRRGRSRR
ncbi:terminase large subunit [Vibrio phage 1.208.B._10N.222.52.A7]|nr:terminase large subunit [Vibrio phage 1.208.B._10N.222.52.A7]